MTKSPSQPDTPTVATGTRERVLDVSARIFRSRGYADTTMNHIAKAAGIKSASIYYYFKSKDEIVEEVLNLGTQRMFKAVRQNIDNLAPGVSFRDKLTVALRTHFTLLHTQGDYTAANIRLFPEAPPPVVKRHMCVRRSYGLYWQAMLKEGQAEGAIADTLDVEIVQLLLLGTLNWSVQWYKPKLYDLNEVAASGISLLLDGLIQADEISGNPVSQDAKDA